jgi:hypothetical protein
MIFAGSEQVIYDFQINMGTSAFNSAITFPNARTSYEESQNVYPVGVKKFISGDMPTGFDPNQLYYLRKTGSNYKFYLTLENAVAETSHFVFTDTKDFLLVFTKFRRMLGTQSIAESVGDMYCCEVPALNLNSTVLYDRCTVVFDGTSYTLKRVSLVMGLNSYIYFPGVSFLFRSDAFLKDGLWQGIDLVVSYEDLPPVPAVYPDYDHMTLTLIIGTASTYNQLGLPHVDGQTQEILEGESGAVVNEVYLSDPNPSSIIAIASTAYTDYFGNYHYAGGYGYWAVPPVVITSLHGSGATAVANLGGGGRITSFTITNGGSGYMYYSPVVDNSINVTLPFNFERRFEMINPSTGTTTWPTSSFPYSGTLTDTDTVRNLPSITYAFSGTSVMPPATVVLKGAYFAGTKATMFPTALELPNCVAVATSTITLSGLQTIGGVPLQAGDRVLVMGNNSYPDSSKSNGIYVASAGSWSRSGDVFVDGSYTFVNQGAGGKLRYRIKASGFVIFPIVFGTSPLFFTAYNASDLPITYDNVDLGDITTTCYHDAETDTYYSAVMTLNGIQGRINFSAGPDLPLTNRAKFLLESSAVFQSTNVYLSNDDFNGWKVASSPFDTVSDPPGVVPPGGVEDVYPNLFCGATQSKPVIDTRIFTGNNVFRTEDASRTGAIMTLQFSRVGRAVKNLGMIGEILYIKAYYGDSYITTL